MVRRVGGLWPAITDYANLLAASERAAHGKRSRQSVARFLEARERECLRLQEELLADAYRPGRACQYELFEPKRRVITVLPFRDRVVHHALLQVIEPILERSLVYECFACRRGKGTHRALDHAQRMLRRYDHSLKLDIAGFFASIRHDQVLARIERRIKDRDTLRLCRRIVEGGADDAPAGEHGRGLPIGSLTSQRFANLQLDPLDHFVKERLQIPGYCRYMDDLVLFHRDAGALREARAAVEGFVENELGLSLKARATRLAAAREGLPFLGWRLYRHHRRLRPENCARSRRLFRRRVADHQRGLLEDEAFVQSMTSICEHLRHGSTRALRRGWLGLAPADGGLN